MTRPYRIWFNRGFSLAPIAGLMRDADPTLEVYISIAPNGARYSGPTQTWTDGGDDPATQSDPIAYLAWVRDTIIDNKIDLFIPTRRRALISAASLPCRVHWPASTQTLALLEDKFAFAEALRGEEFCLPTQLVSSSDDLAKILAEWPADGTTPCVKPQNGVNGLGFWMLSPVSQSYHLQNPDRRQIHPDQYLHALRAREVTRPIAPIVVMPFLPGPEVSFDILAEHGCVLKYIARTKLDNGHQIISSSHILAQQVASLVQRFALHGLVNAQFRLDADNHWRLLEINARPAGGVIYADHVGANMVSDWAGLFTGRLTAETISRPNIDREVAFATVALSVNDATVGAFGSISPNAPQVLEPAQ